MIPLLYDQFLSKLHFSDIDECLADPCQNGGVCVDGVNEYSCDCLDGYSGVHCETGLWPLMNQ